MLTLAKFLKRRYRIKARSFHVWTKDGVRITGLHLNKLKSDMIVIYAHGFMANKEHGQVPCFVQALAKYCDVIAVDLRGHGESDGGCTMGKREVLDIEAAVGYARSLGYKRIITVGSSMGGASIIRHAALYKSQDGVVTIGAFADVANLGRMGSEYYVKFLYHTGRFGEIWSYLTRGTRLYKLEKQRSPLKLIAQVAPLPLLIIHGEWDLMVHPRAARQLFSQANEPKEMIIIPRGGHDSPHLNEHTAKRIWQWIGQHNQPIAYPTPQPDARLAQRI